MQFHLLDEIAMDDNDRPLIPEENYKPFKLPSIQKAGKSSSPISFGVRTKFHSPLPREITIDGNLLHGALKRSSSYGVVTVAFYEDLVSISVCRVCVCVCVCLIWTCSSCRRWDYSTHGVSHHLSYQYVSTLCLKQHSCT